MLLVVSFVYYWKQTTEEAKNGNGGGNKHSAVRDGRAVLEQESRWMRASIVMGDGCLTDPSASGRWRGFGNTDGLKETMEFFGWWIGSTSPAAVVSVTPCLTSRLGARLSIFSSFD